MEIKILPILLCLCLFSFSSCEKYPDESCEKYPDEEFEWVNPPYRPDEITHYERGYPIYTKKYKYNESNELLGYDHYGNPPINWADLNPPGFLDQLASLDELYAIVRYSYENDGTISMDPRNEITEFEDGLPVKFSYYYPGHFPYVLSNEYEVEIEIRNGYILEVTVEGRSDSFHYQYTDSYFYSDDNLPVQILREGSDHNGPNYYNEVRVEINYSDGRISTIKYIDRYFIKFSYNPDGLLHKLEYESLCNSYMSKAWLEELYYDNDGRCIECKYLELNDIEEEYLLQSRTEISYENQPSNALYIWSNGTLSLIKQYLVFGLPPFVNSTWLNF